MASLSLIDPMGALGLTAKYKKALEKGRVGAIRIEFTPTGVSAYGQKINADKSAGDWVPLLEAMASIGDDVAERPFADEKSHIVGKYEIRLDEEAPTALRAAPDKSGLEAAIAALPFKKRRALQMSNKEFELAFLRWEDGVPIPRAAEAAEALVRERVAARGGNRGRGRGRGGRGRGSFLDAQKAQE